MTTMDYAVTLRAIRTLKVQTGSLMCLDCPYEDGCSVHGCAILRNSREHMVDLEHALRSSEQARSDLARQLAAARKQLAEVKADQSWISAKGGLPDRTIPPHDVLVCHDLNCGMFIDRALYSHEKNKWRSAVGMNLKVTHWMPLPEPPEKEA